ncbi:hypothetical protein QJS10_CPA07g00625 [Acorus calamus]|uniref:DUF4283 domain-containing protein n=1 Tax=Acorus calamus TaxID=4465 RepID=A0AAV9EEU0_ACOCL|nr:hypothetical protein QJS10_CPA07g00625 [Acorus calamus]
MVGRFLQRNWKGCEGMASWAISPSLAFLRLSSTEIKAQLERESRIPFPFGVVQFLPCDCGVGGLEGGGMKVEVLLRGIPLFWRTEGVIRKVVGTFGHLVEASEFATGNNEILVVKAAIWLNGGEVVPEAVEVCLDGWKVGVKVELVGRGVVSSYAEVLKGRQVAGQGWWRGEGSRGSQGPLVVPETEKQQGTLESKAVPNPVAQSHSSGQMSAAESGEGESRASGESRRTTSSTGKGSNQESGAGGGVHTLTVKGRGQMSQSQAVVEKESDKAQEDRLEGRLGGVKDQVCRGEDDRAGVHQSRRRGRNDGREMDGTPISDIEYILWEGLLKLGPLGLVGGPDSPFHDVERAHSDGYEKLPGVVRAHLQGEVQAHSAGQMVKAGGAPAHSQISNLAHLADMVRKADRGYVGWAPTGTSNKVQHKVWSSEPDRRSGGSWYNYMDSGGQIGWTWSPHQHQGLQGGPCQSDSSIRSTD